MKQKDIVLIAGVVFFSGLISYFLSNLLFASPSDRSQKVEVVEPISAEFTLPDSRYFNSESVNPTQQIQIQDNSNQQPFNKPSGQ